MLCAITYSLSIFKWNFIRLRNYSFNGTKFGFDCHPNQFSINLNSNSSFVLRLKRMKNDNILFITLINIIALDVHVSIQYNFSFRWDINKGKMPSPFLNKSNTLISVMQQYSLPVFLSLSLWGTCVRVWYVYICSAFFPYLLWLIGIRGKRRTRSIRLLWWILKREYIGKSIARVLYTHIRRIHFVWWAYCIRKNI